MRLFGWFRKPGPFREVGPDIPKPAPHAGWNFHGDVNGVAAPWWLGRAYDDPIDRSVLLLPVPLNRLYGWTRTAWWWLRRGQSQDDVVAIYEQGFDRGRALGEEVGYNRGYAAGIEYGHAEAIRAFRTTLGEVKKEIVRNEPVEDRL